MPSRRQLLQTLLATPVLAQHQHESEPLVTIAPSTGPKAVSPEQFRLLARLTDLIIPRSETPGALDAGAPRIIDEMAAANAELKAKLHTALDELSRKHFLELPESDQIAHLTAISEGPTFHLVKDLTIDAYYGTPQGLVTELGWHGNTYLAEFPGCTHPEHQARKDGK